MGRRKIPAQAGSRAVISRRSVIKSCIGGLCACHASAWTATLPSDLEPLIGDGYRPSDKDERGLWQSIERLEEEIASSTLVVQSPDLAAYTMEVMGRLIGRAPGDLRAYIIRDASFNASMFPNGMMLVHTGFLARAQSEAQFAAVLGHEAGHFYRRHSVERHRDLRRKAGASAFVAAGGNAIGGYMAVNGHGGQSWIDLANSINGALLASVFTFSRVQEVEADAYGITLMKNAGYQPEAASEVWKQLMEEQRRSAEARGKRYKADRASSFSTHPPENLRMRDLAETAAAIRRQHADRSFEDGVGRWRDSLRPHRGMLLEEQIKLNDPGTSLYLVEQMAREGWSGLLRYHEGEVYRIRNGEGDARRAGDAYASAIAFPDVPAEAWRAHGYELLKTDRTDEGRQALTRYLELRPDARDAQMVRFSLVQ